MRHDRVADILVDGPVGFSLDNPRELLEVETEHVGQLIRGESFGDRGESFDVAKHDRNLEKFSAEGRFLLVAVELPDKIDGCVLAHRSHRRLRLLQAFQHLADVPECGSCLRGRKVEGIHLQAFSSDLLLRVLDASQNGDRACRQQQHDNRERGQHVVANCYQLPKIELARDDDSDEPVLCSRQRSKRRQELTAVLSKMP